MAKGSEKMQLILVLTMYLLIVSMILSVVLTVLNPLGGQALNSVGIAVPIEPNFGLFSLISIGGYFVSFISPTTIVMDESIFPNMLYIPFILFPKLALFVLLISLPLPGA